MIEIKRKTFDYPTTGTKESYGYGANNVTLDYKSFVFSGGEVSVKLNNNYRFFDPTVTSDINITARITSSEEFMKLAMLKDAIERRLETPAKINLFLPYVSYGRQDRQCDTGESFSLKVFTKMLNALDFNKILTLDPHSIVTPALINNIKVITQFQIVQKWQELAFRLQECVLVSPDAGSNKKTSEIAGYLNHSEFVRADKLRDLTNGNIIETIVYKDDLKGSDVAICDDLCDGGKTFIELAKVLKAKNCGKVVLYVTHGIFSKGIDALEGIDEIYFTDSFTEVGKNVLSTCYGDRVKVLDINELID